MELKLSGRETINTLATLLIVPYGIETQLYPELLRIFSLLIVPYGIETTAVMSQKAVTDAFNRTLWN